MTELPPIDQFRRHAIEYWSAIQAADDTLATSHTDDGDAVVSAWRGAGVASERLGALLYDPDDAVRYAAAAHLGPDHAAAVEVLHALAADPHGMIAPTARLILATWSR